MSNTLFNRAKDDISSFFQEALACKAVTPVNQARAFQEKRFVLIQGTTFWISDNFQKTRRSALKKIIDAVGVEVLDEKEVSDFLLKNAALLENKEGINQQIKVFIKEVDELYNTDLEYLAPNFAVKLVASVRALEIGPVKCIFTADARAEVKKTSSRIIISENSSARKYFSNKEGKKKIRVPLSPQCFVVRLKASPSKADHRAKWYIDVALSLIRLFTYNTNAYNSGFFPYLGNVDPLSFEMRDCNQKSVIVTKSGQTHAGGRALTPHYQIDDSVYHALQNSKLNKIASRIFFPKDKSVAQRIQRMLGWMTKARSFPDMPERFLLFFTALESLLTSESTTEAVTDTIARNVSVVLANMDGRYELYKKIKELYAVRSRLVHRGDREVSKADCNLIQLYTETVCRVVMTTDLNKSSQDFLEELKAASFGKEWKSSSSSNGLA